MCDANRPPSRASILLRKIDALWAQSIFGFGDSGAETMARSFLVAPVVLFLSASCGGSSSVTVASFQGSRL